MPLVQGHGGGGGNLQHRLGEPPSGAASASGSPNAPTPTRGCGRSGRLSGPTVYRDAFPGNACHTPNGSGTRCNWRAVLTCGRHECNNAGPPADAALNPAATEASVALCRVAATPGSAGGFSQSMEAEMESSSKRRWRVAIHQQYGPAHVSLHRCLVGVLASLCWHR